MGVRYINLETAFIICRAFIGRLLYCKRQDLLTLGAHAQRRLQYLLCVSVCVCVCVCLLLFSRYRQQTGS